MHRRTMFQNWTMCCAGIVFSLYFCRYRNYTYRQRTQRIVWSDSEIWFFFNSILRQTLLFNVYTISWCIIRNSELACLPIVLFASFLKIYTKNDWSVITYCNEWTWRQVLLLVFFFLFNQIVALWPSLINDLNRFLWNGWVKNQKMQWRYELEN